MNIDLMAKYTLKDGSKFQIVAVPANTQRSNKNFTLNDGTRVVKITIRFIDEKHNNMYRKPTPDTPATLEFIPGNNPVLHTMKQSVNNSGSKYEYSEEVISKDTNGYTRRTRKSNRKSRRNRRTQRR